MIFKKYLKVMQQDFENRKLKFQQNAASKMQQMQHKAIEN
jgi:hypothetical protein